MNLYLFHNTEVSLSVNPVSDAVALIYSPPCVCICNCMCVFVFVFTCVVFVFALVYLYLHCTALPTVSLSVIPVSAAVRGGRKWRAAKLIDSSRLHRPHPHCHRRHPHCHRPHPHCHRCHPHCHRPHPHCHRCHPHCHRRRTHCHLRHTHCHRCHHRHHRHLMDQMIARKRQTGAMIAVMIYALF